MPEAIDHGRRQREQPAPCRRPFQRLDPQAHAAPQFIDGPDVLDARDRTRRVMVLQALADAGQRVTNLDAVRLQQFRRTDAGQLQHLGRVVGAAGKNDFLAGAHLNGRTALATLEVAHAYRALALEDDVGDMRMRPHIDIASFARRMQERLRGAHAQAPLDGALAVGHALLDRAVVVGVARNAEAHSAFHEGLAERILPVHGGDGEAAIAAPIGLGPLADPPLQPLEIGQYVRIAPAAIAELRPGIEILALAAVVDMAVDRGRSAERLAARRVDAAAAGPWARLLAVAPVDALHVERLDEAGRQMNVGVPVRRPRFQHTDAARRIFAEPVGEHAACGARADNHIIERFHRLASGAAWLPRLFVELIIEMRLHRRPFAGDDAVNHGVAQRAVRCDLMASQNTVLLGAQAFDAAPALVIEEMRAELDRNAIELLEGMR